jgi:hypothetical protein
MQIGHPGAERDTVGRGDDGLRFEDSHELLQARSSGCDVGSQLYLARE